MDAISAKARALERHSGLAAGGDPPSFAPGGKCDRLYQRAYLARLRLSRRLGCSIEDHDLLELTECLEAAGRHTALCMYDQGRFDERTGPARRASAPAQARDG